MDNEVKKVLFIVNPFAGTGYRKDFEGVIVDECRRNNIECQLEYTKAPGHATQLSRDAVSSGSIDRVIAIGGDGTVNEVARGLLDSDLPMGIVPKGSGNGLARHLQIPMNFELAVKNIFTSRIIAMDTFLVNERLSLNVSGIGFDGHIANIFGQTKKRGLKGYVKHTINELIKFKEFNARIQLGTETLERKAFIIAIANSSQYGNNARIAPAASVSDQLLHLCIVRKVPAYRLDFIISLFRGKLEGSSFCEFVTSTEFSIHLENHIAYHVDGEPCGHGDSFSIRLQPKSLKILVPPNTLRP